MAGGVDPAPPWSRLVGTRRTDSTSCPVLRAEFWDSRNFAFFCVESLLCVSTACGWQFASWSCSSQSLKSVSGPCGRPRNSLFHLLAYTTTSPSSTEMSDLDAQLTTTGHGDIAQYISDTPPSPPPPNNKVTKIACSFCRREADGVPVYCVLTGSHFADRKLRCDGVRPICDNCTRRSIACKYDEHPKKRGPDKVPGGRKRKASGETGEGSEPGGEATSPPAEEHHASDGQAMSPSTSTLPQVDEDHTSNSQQET